MANYIFSFIGPTGNTLFSHILELEDVGIGIDEMTAFMMEEGSTDTTVRFVTRVVPGGQDSRAPYRIRVEKRN